MPQLPFPPRPSIDTQEVHPGTVHPGALPIWFALILTGCVVLFLALVYFKARRRSVSTKEQFAINLFLIFSMFVIFIDMTEEDFAPALFRFIVRSIGLHGTQVLIALLVIAAGFGAHWFKQNNKLFYGYTEVAFAVVSAVLVVTRINFTGEEFRNLSLAQYGTLIGAAYVVARGLNNISDAKGEKSGVW